SSYSVPRDLHSFPTRRSSDLYGAPDFVVDKASVAISPPTCPDRNFDIYFKVSNMGDVGFSGTVPVAFYDGDPINQVAGTSWLGRSEEHTSELQSRENLVCRLL